MHNLSVKIKFVFLFEIVYCFVIIFMFVNNEILYYWFKLFAWFSLFLQNFTQNFRKLLRNKNYVMVLQNQQDMDKISRKAEFTQSFFEIDIGLQLLCIFVLKIRIFFEPPLNIHMILFKITSIFRSRWENSVLKIHSLGFPGTF